MPHLKLFFSVTSHEVGKFSWASEHSQRNKVSGLWCCIVALVKSILTVLNIWGRERGWDLQDKGRKQWNEHLICMVHSGVHVGFSVGQSQFCLKCWKSQFCLLQLNLMWWLSVHPALLRWVLLTGCLWVPLFFPTAAAAVTFIGYTVVYKYGRHLQKTLWTLCSFPQIHTPEGIFKSITIGTNSQADLHWQNHISKGRRRGDHLLECSLGVLPALLWARKVCTSPALHWAGKTSKAQVIVNSGLQQSCWNILGEILFIVAKRHRYLGKTSHPLWHTWGRNWKYTGYQAADGIEKHKIWNYLRAGVTDKAMGPPPKPHHPNSHSWHIWASNRNTMGSPGPPAKTQGFGLGQEWLGPIAVGQWYAGLNWAGG